MESLLFHPCSVLSCSRLERTLSNSSLQLMASLIPLHTGQGSSGRGVPLSSANCPEGSKQCAPSSTHLTLATLVLWHLIKPEMGVEMGGDGGIWQLDSSVRGGRGVGQMAGSSHKARLPRTLSSVTSGCNTHVLWGGWTFVYSPSAKLSECQKLLMLNSKRKLSKEQEQRMLFQQPGRMQVSGRWPCRPVSISSKMFTTDFWQCKSDLLKF